MKSFLTLGFLFCATTALACGFDEEQTASWTTTETQSCVSRCMYFREGKWVHEDCDGTQERAKTVVTCQNPNYSYDEISYGSWGFCIVTR